MAQVLYVVGHPGAAEEGDLMDDVLYVKVMDGVLGVVRLLRQFMLSRLPQRVDVAAAAAAAQRAIIFSRLEFVFDSTA